jgi:hypothetical protein
MYVTLRNIDGDGLLLVEIVQPNTEWTPERAGNQTHNVYLEVLDPDSGEVLASVATKGTPRSETTIPYSWFAGTRLGYLHALDAAGLPEVRIVQYELVANSR